MNITATGGASAAAQVRTDRPRGPRPDDTKMLTPVAEKLGMSVSDLKSAMQSGTTLDSIAGSKGVSKADLLGAIKDGLAAGKPADAPELSTTQLDQLAESIATGAMQGPGGAGGAGGAGRPMGPPPPPHGTNRADDSTIDTVASLLQMSTTDLLDSLTGGTSLSQLAKDRGVSADALLDSISTGMVVDTTA